MVAAGVHAARNIQFNVANVVQIVEIVELHLNGLRNRDAFCIGQATEIAAWAANNIGQKPNIWCCQAIGAGDFPQVQINRQVLHRPKLNFAHAKHATRQNYTFQLNLRPHAFARIVASPGALPCGFKR